MIPASCRLGTFLGNLAVRACCREILQTIFGEFQTKTMEFCLLVASVIMGFLTASEGCSPPIGGAPIDETSIDDKVKGSDVVVQGVVLSSERDRGRLDGELYSVEVEVRCVYKGDPVDRIIHIDEVGE